MPRKHGTLLELMFATKNDGQPNTPPKSSARLFAAVSDLIGQGQQADALPPGDPERLRLLLVATLQGISALTTSGRANSGQTDALVADTVALFTRDHR